MTTGTSFKPATTAAPAATEAPAKEETKAEEKTETAAEPEVKLIGAHVNTVDSSYQAGFDAMKEKLEEVSGGKMTVEIHPNGELGGNEAELVEKMATGTVDMIVASPNFVATTGVKEADLFSIPFLYTGLDHWTAVVDGEVGQTITDKINAGGVLHNLGYWRDSQPCQSHTTTWAYSAYRKENGTRRKYILPWQRQPA